MTQTATNTQTVPPAPIYDIAAIVDAAHLKGFNAHSLSMAAIVSNTVTRTMFKGHHPKRTTLEKITTVLDRDLEDFRMEPTEQ